MKIDAPSTQRPFHAEPKRVKILGKTDGIVNQLRGIILPSEK
ncbi:hypothetical protein CFter6_0921 [Collimonas fungivorans]|uniref:Uncharacterized protein n=1 Tax=Collimonas fungivorans TaxID=158899 RepID=A0A127P7M8_9BURK|nr:hypothetical protein CFter6_0921 [Collimonas fungivorans]